MQQNNKIDKTQIFGFLFFSILMMGVMLYFQNKDTQKNMAREKTVQKTENFQNQTSSNNIEKINLKNDFLTLEFTSLGGQLSSVELNQYKAYNSKNDKNDIPLHLFNEGNSSYGFQFKDKKGKIIDTRNLIFTSQMNGNTITMTSNIDDNTSIQYIYTLSNDYKIDFSINTKGLSSINSLDKATFLWNYKTISAEKGRSQEQTHSEFVYAFDNYNKTDYDARTTMEEDQETLNWISVKQQFFAPIIESKTGFVNAHGNQEAVEKGKYLKNFNFEGNIKLSQGEIKDNFTFYFLPLDLKKLKSYHKNFEEILPLGWFFIGAINRHLFIPLYNLLSSWGVAAGWVIFIMTIIVKIVLSPIMFKQHKLSAMMKVIRPEIDEVNQKFKDADPMKKQQEVMAVYRKAGVNQLAGCLPGLLQIPLFYALFRFFPNMLALRGKSFWFANDLTAYDDLIKLPYKIPFFGWDHISVFALACTVVLLTYTIMTSGNMQQPSQEGMPNMKPLMYIFPVTFFFFLNSAASGLSWYYFVSNTINIIIILIIKNWILDEKKIHAQIQANKSKPKKEGKFQKRMREMMEKAQEQQKIQEQQRKNRKK